MKCDCNYDGGCPSCAGEAVYRVRREDGHEANLCTRCHLTRDTKIARLYDKSDIPRLIERDGHRDGPYDPLLNLFGGIGVVLREHLKLPRADVR